MSDDDHSMGTPTDYPHDSDIDDPAGDGDDKVVKDTGISARDVAAASLVGFASNSEVDRENQHSAREETSARLFGFAQNEC